MVAKSFQTMTILDNPFSSNGKMYVTVKNEKTGKTRVVRWYTEKEYKKMYPETTITSSSTTGFKNLKKVLGFDKEYITIFQNSLKESYQNIFQKSNARFHCLWGWYIVSTEAVPSELTKLTASAKLYWDEVAEPSTGNLKPEGEISAIIRQKFTQGFVPTGAVNQRYEFNNLIISNITPIGVTQYGSKVTYEFFDKNTNNYYRWVTSDRNYKINDTISFKGTIKDFIEDNGKMYTLLTRCIEK